MLKMDKEQDHHLKVAHRALVLYYKIFHSVVNHFFIDLIRTLRCHQSQCHETQASQAKGKPIQIQKPTKN